MKDREVIEAKFRNIIVHDYARIDPEIVVRILKNDLVDFKGFAKDILAYMDAQDAQPVS
ncbi:MAG: HepT-like ribonuclease domain-containing protein [Pseudomonadota bacterium]